MCIINFIKDEGVLLVENFLAFRLEEIPFVVITLVIAFSLHEFAHAYVAYKFGDDTAKRQGRLTLNPMSHLDPLGTLFILLLGFGWAKPVPVNRNKFKRPRLAGVLVSIAGPLSNLLLAFIAVFIYFLTIKLGVYTQLPQFFIDLFYVFLNLNIVLFIFNLLPIPPLDGYRIIEDLVPIRTRIKMQEFEKYAVLIFLVIVITPISDYTIGPIFSTVIPSVVDMLVQITSTILGF